ncbi:dynein heavy chain [Coemansia sp. BCRC 34301]|nr:dynein heavy chain [Coemansia sp. BCRC 34301]
MDDLDGSSIGDVERTGTPGAAAAAYCDPNILKRYLLNLVPVLLGGSSNDDNEGDEEFEAVKAMFSFPDSSAKCKAFANDPAVPVLYVIKETEAAAGSDGPVPEYAFSTATYVLASELSWKPTHAGSIALIKRAPTLDPAVQLSRQIQVMNLPGPASSSSSPSTLVDDKDMSAHPASTTTSAMVAGANPYEALHAYVRFAVSPYFNTYVAAKELVEQQQQQQQQSQQVAGDVDASQAQVQLAQQQGIPMARKKLAELELSLLHLQQNMDIPDTSLNIHPVILRAVSESRRRGMRPSVEAMDAALLSDSGFLNQLQGDVNGWIKEIQKVTKLDRDPGSGTTSQEINFWLSMERALDRIEDQLASDEIVLTMDVLKAAKRFHATVSFRTDTGLKEAGDRVQKYNVLMKDFPINELLAATDIGRISAGVEMIFGHFIKKLKLTAYPVVRALPLAEAISRDLHDQLAKVLGHVRLMQMDYVDFDRLVRETQGALDVWETQAKELANLARELTRKRSEKFIPIKIRAAHAPLQERLRFVHQFRQQHEQLQQTIVRVMAQGGASGGDSSAIDEIRLAYDIVRIVDVLDVTPDGTDAWERGETAYNERVARVENQIISRLRDRLATARNASEMFRVFSKFNALFVRPKIRGAIQEYQTQLINSVKDDIRRLHDTFKRSYRRSEASTMSQLRDLPPVSGAIVWIRQIERQLDMYMRRVEDVLGRGWELYAEGQRLQADSTSFRRKLDTRPLYDAWYNDISRRDLTVGGRVFLVTRHRATGNAFQLGISFDAQLITLFKEVRELMLLGFQVPHTLVTMARDGKRVYPYAVSLMETTKIYRQASHRLQQHPEVMALAAGYRSDVMLCVRKGMGLKWQYFVMSGGAAGGSGVGSVGVVGDSHENRNSAFVREFSGVVSLFQEKVEALISLNDEINGAVRELSVCPYVQANFSAILDRIQALIDRLNLDNYANLEQWVGELDGRLEQVLTMRLSRAIHAWIAEFDRAPPVVGDESDTADSLMLANNTSGPLRKQHSRNAVPSTAVEEGEVTPQIRTLVHELRIRNQVMYLDPPLENARASWIQQLHSWLAAICQQRRPQAARYEVAANADADDLEYDNLVLEYDPGHSVSASHSLTCSSYKDLISRLPSNSLFEAYQSVEARTAQAASYVAIWLQYQALWDLQSDYLLQFLGDDLTRWQAMLLEIKRARSTFDNSETAKYIGAHCIVDYEQVQAKVNAKYDSWQREILNRFGARLGSAMRDTCQAIAAARHELETHSAESSTTSEVVTFITFVQELKRKCPAWQRDVEGVFRGGQRVLEKQRFQFPSDWLYLDQVEGEWSAFNEILKRKTGVIQDQLPSLQMKIIAEDRAVDARIAALCGDWERAKPVQGSLRPDVATNTLGVFHQRITRALEEYDLVSRAKEALDMDSARDERLAPVLEEVADLRAVWAALAAIWRDVDELRDTPWASVVVRKVRQQLDRQLAESKQLPNRMRQYAAYEFMQKTLRGLLKANAVVADLKSDALRDRHWRQLFKALRLPASASVSELTLGAVWDFDIVRNESLIREVIVVAQGEMALEEFLGQIRETWTGYVLELIPYQGKCRLIKGWDDVFAKCSEQSSALAAMKASPYYKVFEEEAGAWEDKLNRIHLLFDVWVDVQRQWVYLEGIFSGSADIKHMLPVESSRFQNINTEFLAAMKKVYKSPFVLDVLNLPNIQRSLERLADLLGKIQKALGEYLERERSSFPRFYFVGDEDLLEIIGNAKDVPRVQKHLRKMFAGLAFIQLNDDNSAVTGMSSREGEHIAFRQLVDLRQFPKINDWLAAIEREMRLTLATILGTAIAQLEDIQAHDGGKRFRAWVAETPAQLVVLAKQAVWTRRVEAALQGGSSDLPRVVADVEGELQVLADAVLEDLGPLERKKSEHLITELVHQRDVIRLLIEGDVSSDQDFAWLSQMRFCYIPPTSTGDDLLGCLVVRMADAQFRYGFEYLGVQERLVQTPLTDRCYLTLTQALERRLGGSPFGPAGTGKTESVKALATQLGRFALVFCCDENFDFQAMGRIFVGLCQVGAWGVFDEFNRLDERILSAVSQQIQTIQLGLRRAYESASSEAEIELLDHKVRLNLDTGIFITMNPGYAGRSNLPDNLKKLFRSFAMTKPDRDLIAQVMLYSQGFRQAELLASKVVPLFNLCAEQLTQQPHYDFGLRALKSVLVSAGNLKRDRLLNSNESSEVDEQGLVIQSVRETVVPKLVAQDIDLLSSLLEDVFPGIEYRAASIERLREAILEVCRQRNWVAGPRWMDKVVQLYQIQAIHHGLMMVGASGSGKTSAWQVLLAALERVEGVEGVSYVIDPKSVSKDDLYGTLDATTREWRDGLFTHLLRKIIDNVRGESARRHWIIFDGDVDPEWVENLNSVLDDNRLLTLPNGERLALPPNVRVMFEVETLRYATLATVSRCGMVWFSDDTVDAGMAMERYLRTLRTEALGDEGDEGVVTTAQQLASANEDSVLSPAMQVQTLAASVLERFFVSDGLVERALEYAGSKLEHIMEFTRARALDALFTLLDRAVVGVVTHNAQHPDFPLSDETVEAVVSRRLVLALVWSLAGDAGQAARRLMSECVCGLVAGAIELPSRLHNSSGGEDGSTIMDYDVAIRNGSAEWQEWASRVPRVDVESHRVVEAGLVVPTSDTLRHEEVLYAWLAGHKPVVLCGPPGSGKTMTLLAALRKLPDLEVAGLNFSSATTPELVLKTVEQHCEYRRTANGVVLSPTAIGRWLVVFCDEINLPAEDRYGTQRVISFLRGLVERGGFWRSHSGQQQHHQWVRLERIQFVGACNPPTDPGRVALSQRFLRHAPVVLVDYPGEQSLVQIYGVLARAALRVQPHLAGYAEAVAQAMVDVYVASQRRFTADQQAHYVYSPRELTRWVRGIYEAARPLETLSGTGLVRLWAHEGLRLFQDRLVEAGEKRWTDDKINEVAHRRFMGSGGGDLDVGLALQRPILFSNWLTRDYTSVGREELREHTRARLRVFYEEELDVPLVLFDDALDHALRLDRVFRQPQGHALLIGISGGGKTTLARFVAWVNGLAVVQVKAHGGYGAADFDDDLRAVLRRSGCRGEKVCFIVDESNVLDSALIERMNTLLANAEVPGLFEGDEHAALMTACREGAARDGLMLDSGEELHRWFTQQVARNLHVVFTMNPPADGSGGLAARAATSPALFNRCVLDWFGDWSDQALLQVARELTASVDLNQENNTDYSDRREAVAHALVAAHQTVRGLNAKLLRRPGGGAKLVGLFCTPRHFLDQLQHFVRLTSERRDSLEDEQRHVHVGLERLQATVAQVEEMRVALAGTAAALAAKNQQATDKLQQIVRDQQEAEQQQQQSIALQADVAAARVAIAERQRVVGRDLARAEPAVEEAQRAVSNIKKQHLSEVRTMANPPAGVKLALEAVCALLGHRAADWKALQAVVRRDDFIASIVGFDTDRHVTKPLRAHMRRTFLERPEFSFDAVSRASKACGPLVTWVVAQVEFSDILERVAPLRAEVAQLEADAVESEARAAQLAAKVSALERALAAYKAEYAELIAETSRLAGEVTRVEAKVERSQKLLASLGGERARWDEGRAAFGAQMATLVGDALIGAAVLAYAGAYDQPRRAALAKRWSTHLSRGGIATSGRVAELLAPAEDRLAWHACGLPDDAVAAENAAMLARFNRFPLVVDPAGTATRFLQAQTPGLVVTSFLDAAFLKHVEAALRFGTPVLVADAEHLDPVLNPVLNRELRRAGGRVLVRLGATDVDVSPAFRLVLATRDAGAVLAPDLVSRVTLVNFAVTRASLQAQSLAHAMQHARPDVDERRRGLLRLQGELRLRLRALETQLLHALAATQGSILDDDAVVATLETLKADAAEISRQAQDADAVMRDVDSVAAAFTPLARAASAVYFALDRLPALHVFYQFSLPFFERIFHAAVTSASPALPEPQRLAAMRAEMFRLAYARAASSLHHEHQPALLLLLAQIKLRADEEEAGAAEPQAWARLNADLDFVLRESVAETGRGGDWAVGGLFDPQIEALVPHDRRPALHAHARALGWLRTWLQSTDYAQIADFVASDDAEKRVPLLPADAGQTPVGQSLRELIVVRLLRPDRLLAAAVRFGAAAFGGTVFAPEATLQSVAEAEVDAQTPIALCSVPGHDAADRVDALAGSSRALRSVAMGSVEGFALADQAIAAAAAQGTWVVLKNVHLAPAWLAQLEKRLQTLRAHSDFRLFLTMEINPKVPTSLLRRARTLVFEPPPGVRANLIESLGSIAQIQSAAPAPAPAPAERTRLHFLLAWLHAIVIERLRYAPLGWTTRYEFGDADFACALATVDSWIDRAHTPGRANIDPARIPWRAIRTLLRDSVYGGRIDSDFDHAVLSSFVARLFRPDAYGADFALVDGALVAPEGTRIDDFVAWCRALPESEPPAWLGLPPNAETLLLVHKGEALVADSRKLRALLDDDDDDNDELDDHSVSNPSDDNASATIDRAEIPAFMRQVEALAAGFDAALVPLDSPSPAPFAGDMTPLLRVMQREYSVALELLARVRVDLLQLRGACRGELKQTNHIRDLLADFSAGLVPRSWLRTYAVPRAYSLSRWMADFTDRVRSACRLADRIAAGRLVVDVVRAESVWLGGLLYPEAFVTATRQAVAKQLGCSLEELAIRLTVGRPYGDQAFAVCGLRVEGATWTPDGMVLNDGSHEALPDCFIEWARDHDATEEDNEHVTIPVYLNTDRKDLLFEARMPFVSSSLVVQRAVAIVAA